MFSSIFGLQGEEHSVTRRNLVANIMDGSLFAFGMSFVSLQTIIPVFVQSMGGSNIAVGLVPVVWVFGFSFPQILIVRHVQKLSWKKPLFLKTSLVQRIPWFLWALVCFFLLEHLSTGVRLSLFFIFLMLMAVSGSINLPVWFDLIAKLTPVKVRGRLFASRTILGGVLGIAGGALAAVILDSLAYPQSYGLLFLLAFCLMMISYWFLTRLEEQTETPIQTAGEYRFAETIRRILRQEPNFANFLLADALTVGSSVAHAFFAVYAIRKFSLTDAYAGLFTVVIMAAMIAGSVLFGFLADRFGHKLNLMICAASTVTASLIAIAAPSLEIYVFAFVFSASTVAINMISRLPMIAELCPEQERPTYVAMTNMITSPFVLLGIGAGWLADAHGYPAVFIFASGLALGALYWLGVKVREPRKIPALVSGNR